MAGTNNSPVCEARQAVARARADVAYTLSAPGNQVDLERDAGDAAADVRDQVLAKLTEADEILAAAVKAAAST